MLDILKETNFDKDKLIPAIVQDINTKNVLMLGYMNKESLERTINTRRVTFFSRSKNRLWIKGETSRNYLYLEDIKLDCDKDTLLLLVRPAGPVCHLGSDSCFGFQNKMDFVSELEGIIKMRKENQDSDSYCYDLFAKGVEKIAQKLGEESAELIIASVKPGNNQHFLEESADLFFHFLILLAQRNLQYSDVIKILKGRRRWNST